MVITSVAGTISMGRFGVACRASSARTTLCWPTSKMRTSNSRAASTLPSTSGRGAWSPPMASTAMVIMGFLSARLREKNLKSLRCRFLSRFALIVSAMRANLVRLLHFVAVRTLRQRGLRQKVVRPPGAGASLRMPSFWVRHSNTPRSRRVGRTCGRAYRLSRIV